MTLGRRKRYREQIKDAEREADRQLNRIQEELSNLSRIGSRVKDLKQRNGFGEAVFTNHRRRRLPWQKS